MIREDLAVARHRIRMVAELLVDGLPRLDGQHRGVKRQVGLVMEERHLLQVMEMVDGLRVGQVLGEARRPILMDRVRRWEVELLVRHSGNLERPDRRE